MKKRIPRSSNSKIMGKSLQDSALFEIIYLRQHVISTQLFMWAIEQKVPVKMYLDTKMLLLSLKKTTLLSYTNEQIEPDAFVLIWIYKSSRLFTRVSLRKHSTWIHPHSYIMVAGIKWKNMANVYKSLLNLLCPASFENSLPFYLELRMTVPETLQKC